MDTDLYEGFAGRYDLAPGKVDENDPRMVAFFRHLFAQNEVHTVLDCACGTGRHLLLFHNLGCEVWGSDVSEAMLAQARKNLTRYGADVSLRQADYRDLARHFKRSFDAVTCLGSIGYMPDGRQFLRAFRSMRAVLREGGILILTVIPTDKQWKEKLRFKLAVNTPEFTRLFVMDFFERTVLYHILDIFHSAGNNRLEVWSAEIYALLKDDQETLLKAAGFHKVSFYGAFDFSPYDVERSDHLITVAYK